MTMRSDVLILNGNVLVLNGKAIELPTQHHIPGNVPFSEREIVFRGWTRYELKRAFDQVCDPEDWRAPIHAIVLPGKLPVVLDAIMYHTSTIPTVRYLSRQRRFVVVSEGYRAGPAGDH